MNYCSALIHLSDIECGEKNRAEAPGIEDGYLHCAKQLVNDVRTVLIEEHGLRPERIGLVVTGDVAYFGLAEEYGKATGVVKHIRESLQIPRQQVAIIPGNHDVNWARCKEAFLRDHSGDDCAEPERRLEARLLSEKLADLHEFISDPEICGKEFKQPETVLKFEGFARLGVALVGFDTTYPCTFCKPDNRGELRHGVIKDAGATALRSLLGVSDRLIPIALLHHCPDVDRDPEEEDDKSYLHNARDVMQWLPEAGFGVVLCGHEHRSKAKGDLRGECRVFVTGSYGLNAKELAHRYRGIESNKYQILLVNPEGVSRFLFRKLDRPGTFDGKWVPDSDRGTATTLDVELRRFQIVARGAAALADGEPELCVSAPRQLSDGKRCVVGMALRGSGRQFRAIKSVTYRIRGEERYSEDRDASFLADIQLDADDLIGAQLEAELRLEGDDSPRTFRKTVPSCDAPV